ncbi:ACP S-malonyltransferase [Synechococcales cyanobacterium C]|uniref:Malonyl CoA-acyl carrier protein transacylase n=1 Tax=Petrachloros mirabilis ULC683 TaxID=2781853 RepID=A0A8K1ZYU6_9CYAN|nr:ACP S-malonyltransferase [Petrachloros mirabilis]NCJ07679.1 ACP S-malonyltransferase [Petrachloros mirabilis ULC683]
MTKTAWVFPGQGSQALGMDVDLLTTELGKTRLQQAESILGWSVPQICQSDEATLSRTLYTQPCLYVISATLADLLRDQGAVPDVAAGHSLGEYVALYAAGVIDFESGLRLVKRRAELMDQASDGTMVALMGFDRDQLEQQVQAIDGVVLANDNHAGQGVISGTSEAVTQLLGAIKVKRAVELNVSGAFHSPLMAEAAASFQEALDGVSFKMAQLPVLSNVEPTAATDADQLRERLRRQMTGPVRWREIALGLSELGIERVIEVGPGRVLTGLIKRTCPQMTLENISSFADMVA